MKLFISIDREIIKHNHCVVPHLRKPVWCIQYEDGRPETHHWEIEFLGPAKTVYDPSNVEPGDAFPHAWIEADEATVLFS